MEVEAFWLLHLAISLQVQIGDQERVAAGASAQYGTGWLMSGYLGCS